MSDQTLFKISCAACTWRALKDYDAVAKLLRGEGMLRRQKEADETMLEELLAGIAPQLKCPDCGTPGLRVALHTDDDWRQAVTCEVCRKPIPHERLEAIPGTRRCAKCQQADETNPTQTEPEYCPRCGSLLVLRMSNRAGLTQYKMFCTAGCKL